VVSPQATFFGVMAGMMAIFKDLEAYMAEQRNHATSAEDDLDVVKGIVTVLDTLVEGLEDLAEELGPADEDYAEIEAGNAGKTAEEIAIEDEIVERLAGPFVHALDDMTALINNAAMEITALAEAEKTADDKETR
jgi:hypothetical protein